MAIFSCAVQYILVAYFLPSSLYLLLCSPYNAPLPLPSPYWEPLACSLDLGVCFFFIFTTLLYFLDSTDKWDPTVFVFLHLTYFTLEGATGFGASIKVRDGRIHWPHHADQGEDARVRPQGPSSCRVRGGRGSRGRRKEGAADSFKTTSFIGEWRGYCGALDIQGEAGGWRRRSSAVAEAGMVQHRWDLGDALPGGVGTLEWGGQRQLRGPGDAGGAVLCPEQVGRW